MQYKKRVPAHVAEKVVTSGVICDCCGNDVMHTSVHSPWAQDEVTIKALMGKKYPESDSRTAYFADLCGKCWMNVVMPALKGAGVNVRQGYADQDPRVWEAGHEPPEDSGE